jgi:NTP pyrophosphatase (non-canonical NTP hydrolase)
MTLDEYQQAAMATAVYPNSPHNALLYTALGLASEAGEYAGKVKKLLRDAEFSRAAALAELGDVLWYVAAAANALGVTLDTVAQGNIDKLADRKARDVLRGSGDYR